MIIRELIHSIENIAPVAWQESYDNAGLIIGDASRECTGALISLDVTEAVLDEAITLGYNLIIAHHPLVFKGIKRIGSHSDQDRCIIKAIKNDIAVYAAHTNLDNAPNGVNKMICDKLGLLSPQILEPMQGSLRKLVVFVPENHAGEVRKAMFEAGAGHIGQYDQCSFNSQGTGTFRAGEKANPWSGETGEIQYEPEVRIEVICDAHHLNRIVAAMKQVHPYEEVAWDAYSLVNANPWAGSGMVGMLAEDTDEITFLEKVKTTFGIPVIKHSPLTGRKIRKVAVCGGSGNFLISKAMSVGADIYITGELKYHDYFLAEGKILLADAGHYETEQFTKELLYQIVKEKFTTFATRISMANTNPVNYL